MSIEVIDEHQEAYVVIDEALRAGTLRRPVALVHVDSHDDLDSPFGDLSCYGASVRQYAERQLSPGDFLLPLLLRGHVKKVIHVDWDDRPCERSNVGSLRGEGTLIRRRIESGNLACYPDHRGWLLHRTSDLRRLSRLVNRYDAVLGIDCDYFSLNRIPRPIRPFRYTTLQRRRIRSSSVSDDRYRMRLRFLPDQVAPRRDVTFNESRPWVELLVDYFCCHVDLRPALTVISRSCKGGFTPRRFARLIEKRLVLGLRNRPSEVRLPLDERLQFTPFVASCGRSFYSYSTNGRLPADRHARIVIDAVVRRRTIAFMRERFLRLYAGDESTADYELLRTIFNLKKTFVIR